MKHRDFEEKVVALSEQIKAAERARIALREELFDFIEHYEGISGTTAALAKADVEEHVLKDAFSMETPEKILEIMDHLNDKWGISMEQEEEMERDTD